MSDKPSALTTLETERKNDLAKRLGDMEKFSSFDWRSLPPNIMAQVLMKKPYRGKANEPDYYLSPEQALVFAMRCFELGLSPLSSEVWFDRDRWSVNVTLEGKLRLARERGNVGPPTFANEERPWRAGATKLAGFEKEPGIKCTISVNQEPCSYMCWMSEWYMPMSPVWKAKPMHMLQIRAYDKALAFAAGAGISDMPSEREIQAEEIPEALPAPTVTAKRVEFKPHSAGASGNSSVVVVNNDTDLQPILKASVAAAEEKKNK
jgi:hypothetical protein